MAGLVSGAAAVALLAMALASAQAPVPAATTHVHIEGLSFNPFTASLLAGEAVAWHNHDDTPHKPVADDLSFDALTIAPGGTSTVPFPAAGTVPYHCEFHEVMRGRVQASEPGARPDLAIAAIDPAEFVPGALMDLNVTVRNLGLSEAPPSTLEVAYRYHGADYLIANAATPAVGPRASEAVVVEWITVGKVGDFLVRARADIGQVIVEADETNNEATRLATVVLQGFPGLDLTQPL